jgi:FRG domain-containing protein
MGLSIEQLGLVLASSRRGLGAALVLRADAASDVDALARGVAALMPQPVQLVRLKGEHLRPGEGARITEPLLRGEPLVVAAVGALELPARLAHVWTDYCEHSRHMFATVARHLVLEPLSQPVPEGLGPLVIVHVGAEPALYRDNRAHLVWLDAQEVAELDRRGATFACPGIELGLEAVPASGLTMRSLCLLHERDPDGTPRRNTGEILMPAAPPLTWTDLQALLQGGSVRADGFDALYLQGRLDDVKYEYALAAMEFIARRREQGPHGLGVHAMPDIWEVVWNLEFLEAQGHIFRGQFNAQWPLECSLLRPVGDGPMEVGLLVRRLAQTGSVLAELRSRLRELFGAELDDDSLLAVAQHFGCPTPLLDYTKSFRVAAFFATHQAGSTGSGEGVIGVIHHMQPSFRSSFEPRGGRQGLSLLDLAGIRPGELRVIEPRLPDEDDRIRRQQGVFVGGFRARDLQGIAIDRIYFRQAPGELFEDERAGVTRAQLMPPTPLTDIVKSLRDGAEARGAWEIHPLLASTELPREGLIGSEGIELYSQLHEGNGFLGALDRRATADGDQASDFIRRVVRDYFQNARVAAEVGAVPQKGDEDALLPIALAVADLAAWSGCEEQVLWQAVRGYLPRQWPETGRAGDRELGQFPGDPELAQFTGLRQRIALACAVYLAGWDHLRQVGGDRARQLTLYAQMILDSGRSLVAVESQRPGGPRQEEDPDGDTG